MENETNNKFSFVINASDDWWYVSECDNISYSKAEYLSLIVEAERGIFADTSDEYKGEIIIVRGNYENNILELETSRAYERSLSDEVYKENKISDSLLAEEVLLQVLEDNYFEQNTNKQVINEIRLDYYINRNISSSDIETIYDVYNWQISITVSYAKYEKEEKCETIKLKKKIKDLKDER